MSDIRVARIVTAQNLHEMAAWCRGRTWAASVVVPDAQGMERQARIGDTIAEFSDGHFEVIEGSMVSPVDVPVRRQRIDADLVERNRIIEEALASDEAIRAFGLAWGQANARLTLKPGDRRKAGGETA